MNNSLINKFALWLVVLGLSVSVVWGIDYLITKKRVEYQSMTPREISKIAGGNGLVISLICDDQGRVSMVQPLDGELITIVKEKKRGE